MNILLTGGAGFIGSNLVSFFLDQPTVDFVRVMDRSFVEFGGISRKSQI